MTDTAHPVKENGATRTLILTICQSRLCAEADLTVHAVSDYVVDAVGEREGPKD